MNNQNIPIRRNDSLVFSKWRRKGYSLFFILGKIVRISVLSVAYFSAVPLQSAAVEKDTSEVKMRFDLEEVEVSASRTPSLFSQIVRVLTVIDSKEIERAPVESVEDLLGYIAAADIRQRGAHGVQADVSIRGGTFDQTIFLLNGVNITDPQTGHHNLNIPVDLAQIERIEVLEGPAARVYGPSAFSGAINIVTRKPEGNDAALEIGGGSFGYLNFNLSGSFQTGITNHLVAGSRKKSGGYIENTDFKISNLFYSSIRRSEKGMFSFQLGLSEKAFGANSFYTPKYPNQYERTGTVFSSASWELASPLHITPVLYWRRHSDKFMLFRETSPEWYTSHNYHLTNTWGANLNSWIRWGAGKTAMGAEFRSENILSNVLGNEMETPVKISGEKDFYTKSKGRFTGSFFIDNFINLSSFSFSAGLMSNYISDNQNGWSFFPGFDAGFEFDRGVKMVASFNTSMRMPTFTDLYYSGPENIGNPDLKPEYSMTLESGFKINKEFLRGHFIVFFRKGKNMIDWVKENSNDLWQPQNLTELKSLGTEVQMQLYPKSKFGGEWPEELRLSYFYNNQSKEHAGFISNYVLDNLKHKFLVSLSQKIARNVSIDLRGTFQDREGTYTRFENKMASGEASYKPFWLFDGKIIYKKQHFRGYVSANNIFNLGYFDLGNIVQPGLWIKAGGVYRFKFD